MVRLPDNVLCPMHTKFALRRRLTYPTVAIALFQEVQADPRFMEMCRKDDEGKAMVEDMTPNLAKINPLCCFIGGKRFLQVLDACGGSKGRA